MKYWISLTKTSVLFAVLALASIACTDDRGLIVNGDVVFSSAPANEVVWIGMWTNAELKGAPLRSTTLAREAVSGIAGTNPFRWATGQRFIDGETVYFAAYYEPKLGDGIPAESTVMIPSVPASITIGSSDEESIGNGVSEVKPTLLFDFLAGLVSTRSILEAGYQSFVDRMTAAPIDSLALVDMFHPLYRDAIGLDHASVRSWYLGALDDGTLEQGPLAGWASQEQQDRIRKQAVSSLADIDIADTRREASDVSVQYVRLSDNHTVTILIDEIAFEIEDGEARIRRLDIAGRTLSLDEAAMQVSGDGQLLDGPYEFDWDSFGDELSYTVALDQFVDDGYFEQITFAAGVSREAEEQRIAGVLHPDCVSPGIYDVCLVVQPVTNTSYRIRVTPAPVEEGRPFVSWLVHQR